MAVRVAVARRVEASEQQREDGAQTVASGAVELNRSAGNRAVTSAIQRRVSEAPTASIVDVKHIANELERAIDTEEVQAGIGRQPYRKVNYGIVVRVLDNLSPSQVAAVASEFQRRTKKDLAVAILGSEKKEMFTITTSLNETQRARVRALLRGTAVDTQPGAHGLRAASAPSGMFGMLRGRVGPWLAEGRAKAANQNRFTALAAQIRELITGSKGRDQMKQLMLLLRRSAEDNELVSQSYLDQFKRHLYSDLSKLPADYAARAEALREGKTLKADSLALRTLAGRLSSIDTSIKALSTDIIGKANARALESKRREAVADLEEIIQLNRTEAEAGVTGGVEEMRKAVQDRINALRSVEFNEGFFKAQLGSMLDSSLGLRDRNVVDAMTSGDPVAEAAARLRRDEVEGRMKATTIIELLRGLEAHAREEVRRDLLAQVRELAANPVLGGDVVAAEAARLQAGMAAKVKAKAQQYTKALGSKFTESSRWGRSWAQVLDSMGESDLKLTYHLISEGGALDPADEIRHAVNSGKTSAVRRALSALDPNTRREAIESFNSSLSDRWRMVRLVAPAKVGSFPVPLTEDQFAIKELLGTPEQGAQTEAKFLEQWSAAEHDRAVANSGITGWARELGDDPETQVIMARTKAEQKEALQRYQAEVQKHGPQSPEAKAVLLELRMGRSRMSADRAAYEEDNKAFRAALADGIAFAVEIALTVMIPGTASLLIRMGASIAGNVASKLVVLQDEYTFDMVQADVIGGLAGGVGGELGEVVTKKLAQTVGHTAATFAAKRGFPVSKSLSAVSKPALDLVAEAGGSVTGQVSANVGLGQDAMSGVGFGSVFQDIATGRVTGAATDLIKGGGRGRGGGDDNGDSPPPDPNADRTRPPDQKLLPESTTKPDDETTHAGGGGGVAPSIPKTPKPNEKLPLGDPNNPLVGRAVQGDADAVAAIANKIDRWEVRIREVQTGTGMAAGLDQPTAKALAEQLIKHREALVSSLGESFGAARKEGSSKEPGSDVDLNIPGDDAGAKLIAAERFLDNNHPGWRARYRMGLMVDSSRVRSVEDSLKALSKEDRVKVERKLTAHVEALVFARRLQNASDVDRAAMLANPPAGVDVQLAKSISSLGPEASVLLRNQALMKGDELATALKAETDPDKRRELAAQLSLQQMLANAMDGGAFISYGGVKGHGEGKPLDTLPDKLTDQQGYQAVLDQVGMIDHVVHEAGGVLEAARSYELFKYVSRICDTFEHAGIPAQRLAFYRNWADLLSKVDRRASAAGDRPEGAGPHDFTSPGKQSESRARTDPEFAKASPDDAFLIENYNRFADLVENLGTDLRHRAMGTGGHDGFPANDSAGLLRLPRATATDGPAAESGAGQQMTPNALIRELASQGDILERVIRREPEGTPGRALAEQALAHIKAKNPADITPADFATSEAIQREWFEKAALAVGRQRQFAHDILNGAEADVDSQMKRDDPDEFVQGVLGKCQRNGYSYLSQMDDVIRGRIDVEHSRDVRRVVDRIRKNQEYTVVQVIAPRSNDDGVERYPRWHIIVRDTRSGLTHEWQIGTRATSELYQKEGIDIPPALAEAAEKLGKKFNNDIHDIEFDVFQRVKKMDKALADELGITAFIARVAKASDKSGKLDGTKGIQGDIESLHKEASTILAKLVERMTAEKVAELFH